MHVLNEEMRGEIFMTRNTLNFKQLIEKNKEELKNDHKALEKIERNTRFKILEHKSVNIIIFEKEGVWS